MIKTKPTIRNTMKPSTKTLCALTLLIISPQLASAEERYKSVGMTIYPAGSPEAERQVKEMTPPAEEPVVGQKAEVTPSATPEPRIPDDCPACGMG
jgi:hypothetical protein